MDWFVKSLGGAVLTGSQLVKAMESTIEDLDASVKELVRGGSSGGEHPEDLAAEETSEGEGENPLKITEELKEEVRKMTLKPQVFLDHRLAGDTEAESDLNLSISQQRHARTILTEVPEFSQFRYLLTPSQIQEVSFWRVYFDLIAQIHQQTPGIGQAKEANTDPEREELSGEVKSKSPAGKPARKSKGSGEKRLASSSAGRTEEELSESLSGDFLEIKRPNRGRLDGEDGYITDFSTAGHFQTDPVPV